MIIPEELEQDLMTAYPGLPEMQYQCIAEQANYDQDKAMALAKVQHTDMMIRRAQKLNRERSKAAQEEAIWD